MKLTNAHSSGRGPFSNLKQDLLYTWRTLRQVPLFALAVVLPLAMGIGANTAIFSVADALLRQPLPFPQMERMVLVTEISPARPDAGAGVTPANYLDWTSQSTSFSSLAAFTAQESALTGSGAPEAVATASVAGDFFSTLGTPPLQGRWLTRQDATEERSHSVVLSYSFWQRRFAGDPGIIGKELALDSVKYTVAGVLRNGGEFPLAMDIWKPMVLGARERQDRGSHTLQIVGRLKPGVSVTQAQTEMKEIALRLSLAYPGTNQGWGARVRPFTEFISGGLTARYTRMLMGAVLFVLLIVCANVANLQLVRGIVRKREWSVRYALGATRWHVVRLLLIESVALSLASVGMAFWFANISLRLIRINMPPTIARFISGFDQIHLNYKAVLFTLGIAVIAGIVSGVLPAIFSSRADINQELQGGGKSSTADRSHRRVSTFLLIGEVAVTLVLLVGTGLMVRGSSSLRQEFAGMQPAQVLTARVHLLGQQYAKAADSQRVYQRLLGELARTPGVISAATASTIPSGGQARSALIAARDAPPAKAGESNIAALQIVSPDFFQTLGIPVREGRVFQEADDENSAPVAIVNRSLARHFWPNQDPIGRQLRITSLIQGPWLRVVGLAEDVRYNWFDADAGFVVYRPAAQAQQRNAYVVLRTQGDPERFGSLLRERLAAIDREQPISSVRSWDDEISESMLGLSYVRVMMFVLAVLAMVVASVGLYGLMTYSVETRKSEIGIRMALGAQRMEIMRMILAKGMWITTIGSAAGLGGSFLLGRALSSLVFGVSALDPLTFAGTAAILAGVGVLACYVPARQASQVDPLNVLRTQ